MPILCSIESIGKIIIILTNNVFLDIFIVARGVVLCQHIFGHKCRKVCIRQKSCYNGVMEIKREDILHLAKLSEFSLSDDQITSLGVDLQNIIKYISQLDELDVEGVEPTYQVFEMENVWREDKILPQEADRSALLALAPEVEANQVKVPKVL